ASCAARACALSGSNITVTYCSCTDGTTHVCPDGDSHETNDMYFCENISGVAACPDTNTVAVEVIYRDDSTNPIEGFQLHCRCSTYESSGLHYVCEELIG
uniref:Turripeptide OL71 n=1 Tax=Iotyrris olangoensis TaxID=2420066 RepID=TU71_IOTOL|nr:RecName: Full=Turripeptide OL71 [Iotyrris olangoensis]